MHLTVLQEVLHQPDGRASAHMLSPLDCIVPSRKERQGNECISSARMDAKHVLNPCQFHLGNLRVLRLPALQVNQPLVCCNADCDSFALRRVKQALCKLHIHTHVTLPAHCIRSCYPLGYRPSKHGCLQGPGCARLWVKEPWHAQ